MSNILTLQAGLKLPRYMPFPEPDFKTLDQDVLRYRPVPGIGHNDEENDGIFYYYDEPLVFVADVEGHRCIVTLVDQDYTNDGMAGGYAVGARGWDQHLAIAVSDEILHKVYNSQLPMRSLYEQPDAKTWFIHKNWCSLRVKDIEEFDERQWYSVYRVWRDVPVLDRWKSDPGAYLNPEGKQVLPWTQTIVKKLKSWWVRLPWSSWSV